jgi:predicted PurR-regulated permease PerM
VNLRVNNYGLLQKARDLFFLVLFLYFARPLLVPLLYGGFVALVLYPFCRWMETKRISRFLSVIFTLLIVSALFLVLIGILIYQYTLFRKDLPLLATKIKPLYHSFVTWVGTTPGFEMSPGDSFFYALIKHGGGNLGELLKSGITGTFNALFVLVIVPLYAGLLLYFRSMLVRSIYALAGERNRDHVTVIITGAVQTYGKYIKGMVLVYLVVGVLNSFGLLMLGIPYALLFGMLSAVMTIIPYLGIILSSLLPISIAWLTTGSLYYPLGVIAVFSFVQYLEANFIFPFIVGKKVNVNILASIISVIAGGLLWGVGGMVLFLPLVAVLKVVCDEMEDLKPLSAFLAER